MPPASVEFISLCQTQLNLLVRMVGASLAVVYVTEEWSGEWSEPGGNPLRPVAIAPEGATGPQGLLPQGLLPQESRAGELPPWGDGSGLRMGDSLGQGPLLLQAGAEGDDRSGDVVPLEPLKPWFGDSGSQLPMPDGWGVDALPWPQEFDAHGDRPQSPPSQSQEAYREPDRPQSPPSQSQQSQSPQGYGEPDRPQSPQSQSPQAQSQQAYREPDRPQSPQPHQPLDPAQPVAQHQVMLPLQQDNFVLGFLVVEREGLPWQDGEYEQLKQVAHTLAMACLLERRRQWIQERYHQQELAQERQQDVLDTLLHQVRNPLTALRTFGKLLLRRLQPGDQQWEAAQGVVRQGDRLQFLMQQLGEQVEQWGMPEPAPNTSLPLALPPASFSLLGADRGLEPCDLGLILEPLLAAAQAQAQERGLGLGVALEPGLGPVVGQGQALQEVLSNVVDNALKYTPRGGEVAVVVRSADWEGVPGGEVVVTDTGLGIPPEDLLHLGERHYRGVQGAGEIPGTGLGLAIVWELMAHVQGHVEVTSPVGDRPGTQVRLWFPRWSPPVS